MQMATKKKAATKRARPKPKTVRNVNEDLWEAAMLFVEEKKWATMGAVLDEALTDFLVKHKRMLPPKEDA